MQASPALGGNVVIKNITDLSASTHLLQCSESACNFTSVLSFSEPLNTKYFTTESRCSSQALHDDERRIVLQMFTSERINADLTSAVARQ